MQIVSVSTICVYNEAYKRKYGRKIYVQLDMYSIVYANMNVSLCLEISLCRNLYETG